MADIKTQTREVIQQLSEIARWSETAGQGLDRFAGVLSKLGGTSTQFLPSMTNLISVINEMALSMRELGFSDQHINRVRTSLQAYAAEYGNLANIQGRLASMPRGGPQGPGLIGRLGPSREGRRNAEISRMRQEAANQAREAGRIPIQDIAAAGGDIQRIIGLRREYLAVVNQEQKKLLETAIAQRRLVEIEAKRNQLAAERLALQQQSAGRVFNQRTSAFQARRGAAGAAGGRVGPGGLQGPVTEVQGSLQEITTQFKDFIPGGQVGVENLTNKMNALGITSARVTSATEELSTGVRTLRFRIDRGNGAVASATVHMDRWGGIMRETGNRFRTFTSAVGNNLVKVVQWGVATGFVYGAMRNLQQTIREITEIEKELANVQVALGKGQGNLNEIFKEAAVIADLTSQSIMGVVESYALAFQATGGLEDMATRGAQANALLTESMVLAQLSGLEQAKAMDTLIGALRQTGMELDEGRELLDKWVAVARESNVSVGTMAETYAIVGAQAKDLGLEFEQLNALAATLAEATPLSATEVGNAMRGILAGFQTTQAEGVLARFGIETRTATGELRNFWELLNEIAELIAAGAISPAEISEISNAIGGGYRRGGQVQIILRGMARSQQLVNEQFDTGGQAADALEIKMATLQSAITRLGNAFTGFAHTLGDEGGVLGVSKLVVEILTSLIGIMDRMTAGLGKATPALVAFGAAMLVLRSSMGESFLARTAPAFLTRAAGLGRTGAPSVQARLAGVTGGSQVSAAGVGGYSIGRSASGIGSRLSSGIGGINPLSGLLAAGIIAPTAIQAAQAAPQERPEAFAKAGAQIAGAIAGGLIGGPIGVVLGSSIGGAFADAVIDEERDIAGRLAETFATQSAENLKDEGIGDEIVSSDIINLLPESIQAAADISAFFARIIDVLPGEQFGHIERPTGKGVVSEDVLRGLLEGTIGTEAIQGMISDEARAEFAKLLAQQMEAGIEEVEVAGAFRTQIERATPAVQAAAGTVVDAFLDESRRQFILGDIGLKEFTQISAELTAEGISDNVALIRESLSLAGEDVGIGELVQTFLDLGDSATVLESAAQRLSTAQDILNFRVEEYGKTSEEVVQAEQSRDAAAQNLVRTYQTLAQAQRLSAVERLEVFDVGKLTPQQVQFGVQLAEAFQRSYFLRIAEGNEELVSLLEQTVEPLLLKYGEGLGQRFGESIAVGSQFLAEAFEALDLDTQIQEAAFSFRDLREQLGTGDIAGLENRYQRVVGTFQKQFPDYEIKESPIGLILKDGFHTMDADLQLLDLAMQDLIDVNEQQLEGVWNIPTGMTAFVAWSSLFSRNLPSGDTSLTSFDPFGDEEGQVPEETMGLDEQLSKLNEQIAALEGMLGGVGPRDIDRPEFEPFIAELESLQSERSALLEQLTLQQFAGSLGVDEPTAALLDQMREVLTVQNKIELNANIRLVVDGRTLANVIKQYLFEDLVGEANKTVGGGGGNYVIGAE